MTKSAFALRFLLFGVLWRSARGFDDTALQCYNAVGEDYRFRGPNVADGGAACLSWADPLLSSVDPTQLTLVRTAVLRLDNTYNHSYCRNPLGIGVKPWCYIQPSSSSKPLLQNCVVPKCPEACNFNPVICHNGATCVPSSDRTSYSCFCRAGFTGMHCDLIDPSTWTPQPQLSVSRAYSVQPSSGGGNASYVPAYAYGLVAGGAALCVLAVSAVCCVCWWRHRGLRRKSRSRVRRVPRSVPSHSPPDSGSVYALDPPHPPPFQPALLAPPSSACFVSPLSPPLDVGSSSTLSLVKPKSRHSHYPPTAAYYKSPSVASQSVDGRHNGYSRSIQPRHQAPLAASRPSSALGAAVSYNPDALPSVATKHDPYSVDSFRTLPSLILRPETRANGVVYQLFVETPQAASPVRRSSVTDYSHVSDYGTGSQRSRQASVAGDGHL